MDEARDLGNQGGIVTPVAPKKQTRRRQTSLAYSASMATPPVAQGNDNFMVLRLLMDLSSDMLMTEEYIIQHKEADAIQTRARLVCIVVDALQPS